MSENQNNQVTNNATKQCKYCKTYIPKKAKYCPNCRKKQGGKLKWFLVVCVAVTIISAAIADENEKPKRVTNSSQNENGDSEVTTNEEEVSFGVGETAEQKDIQITLLSVTESAGSTFIKPSDGQIYLLCEFEINNNSSKDIAISSLMNFEAYCDGYSMGQNIGGLQAPEANGKNQLDGNVAAGKKMNGIIAYEVPVDWKELEINVSPDFWSSRDFKFIATKQ